ncbi:uncharacterized protein LOC134540970 [Bacillus rossius redtenbacheri]|uniref:uncharacterized protein LOC134540970 n=1 Tax=Bacillus rossius redtenbacheri TaxID=93214 RepID=UPI002FDD5187
MPKWRQGVTKGRKRSKRSLLAKKIKCIKSKKQLANLELTTTVKKPDILGINEHHQENEREATETCITEQLPVEDDLDTVTHLTGVQRTYSKSAPVTCTQRQAQVPLEDNLESSDEELPPLVIETENKRATFEIEGRRLVDIMHFIREYDKIANHKSVCTGGKYILERELRIGLITKLRFQCEMCNKTRIITTVSEESEKTLNTAFVWGAIATGIGHSQAEEFFSVIDVPVLGAKHFMKHEKRVEKVWEEKLTKKMAEAINEEKRLAIESGDIDEGYPFITVVVDGGWPKRSYGHGFSSNSGMRGNCDNLEVPGVG